MVRSSAPSLEHSTPLRVYLTVGALLLLLTAVTIAVSHVHLGTWNLVVALTIAAVKAALVAFFFMHLYYDNKFYFVLFVIGVLFLALFVGFCMIDTLRRGDLYREVGSPIRKQAVIYPLTADSTGVEAPAIDSSAAVAPEH